MKYPKIKSKPSVMFFQFIQKIKNFCNMNRFYIRHCQMQTFVKHGNHMEFNFYVLKIVRYFITDCTVGEK